ncbi:MAG: PEP-CTERM sorting domain-containing protein [Nitrospiraceae bacterium]|nr:PEP-CTERM sorting domain-containing protein [Nitrospiraceae bacterium]
MKNRIGLAVTILFLLSIVLVGMFNNSALADTIYTLSVPNTALSVYPGPYASVDIGFIGPITANVTFTGLTHTPYIYLLGGENAADLNVNATSFSVTGEPSSFTVGSGEVDGFGNFNLTLKNTDGYTDAVNSLSFILTNTSGTWSDSSNVLKLNSNNAEAAAHIFVTESGLGSALATGYASNSGAKEVPEPGTLLLLGIGLALAGTLSFVRRKRADC